MQLILKLTPLPLLAALFVACSGSADPEPTPPLEGDSEQALAADDASATLAADKRRGGRGHRGGRGRGRGHGHHHPPPEPSGQSCEVAGQTFPDGEAVPSGDSCNSCGCNDGSVICTLALCEPVICAEFVEEPDGVCSRFPLDPCQFQDPDCDQGGGGASCEAAGQTFPDGAAVPSGDSCNSCGCNDGSIACTEIACEPQVCALFVELPDGVCSRFPLDPCISQDPDCIQGGGAASCEAGGQTFADGEAVPSGDSCNGCGCNDGSVICTAVACEPVFCALFVEQSDGVCSRFPLDPCKSQDPDCIEPDAGSCQAAGQAFPNGSEVPSGDSCNTCSCTDGSVSCTLALCEPVFCALFLEESDGVCSRFPLDPCKSQDPDCVESTEPTEPTEPAEPTEPGASY